MPPAFRPRAFLLAAWSMNVCLNAFYIAPAPVFLKMTDDLGISYAQAGSLISFYLLAILALQIPGGYVADRRDPRKVVALACSAFVALTVPMAFFPRYDVLLTFRILAGFSVAFIFAPSAFLVSRAFERAPGRALGLFLSAPPAGVALGNFLSPSIAATFGWPAVFAAFSLPLIALIPAFLLSARGFPVRRTEAFTLRDFAAAFRSLELWKVGLAFAASYAAYIFYSSWVPTYVERGLGITDIAVVAAVSSLVPAAGILSRPIGGHLAETRFRADKRWVPGIAFAFLALAGLAVPYVGAAAIPLFVACGFLAQFPFTVYYLFSTQILPPRFQGTAYAFNNTVSIVGGAISPALAGYLLDRTGSFLAAFAMIAAAAMLGLALTASVRER